MKRLRPWTLVAAVILPCGAWLWISRLVADPRVSLLVGERGAQWIVMQQPFDLTAILPARYKVVFRKRFTLSDSISHARLTVRAFRGVDLWLDGRSIFKESLQIRHDWKQPRTVELNEALLAGTHKLVARVVNESAPPALLLRSDALALSTGPDWDAYLGGDSWEPAALAAAPRPTELSRRFLPAPTALWKKLPFIATVFGAAFCTTLWIAHRGPVRMPASGSIARWVLLLAWAVLGAHNLVRLSDYVGFDGDGHYEYIRYVAEGRGIPLATDGWQMFQPPLYYLVSAPFHLLFVRLFDPEMARRLLRFLPFSAGAAQVQLAYLALRRTFPERGDLQAIGTAFAGLLPMNLYVSQGLGNEPMAGCLSGAVLVACLALLDSPPARSPWRIVGLGLLLGLALLTKVTAVLLVPPLLGAIAYSRRKDTRPLRRAAGDAMIVLATALAVAGWYYVRNWILLGRPFVAGWDQARGITWWQDPGLRTPEEFLRFGEALVHPITAGAVGFWDALYSTFWADGYLSGVLDGRPPWNYGFLLASVPLALVPTLLLLTGSVAAFVGGEPRERVALRFAAAAIGLQMAALLELYLQVPVYSIGKAHYTLGVAVCYAMLLAAGLERLGHRPVIRSLLYGGLAAWGIAVYAAYLVVA